MKHLTAMIAGMIGAVLVACLGVAVAHTGTPTLTTFSNGQVLTASALNDNFSHLHNTLTAGLTNTNIQTGAAIAYSKLNLTNSLLNSDVASGAAIAHSKLATPALVPKAFARVGAIGTACNGAAAMDTVTCTLAVSSGVTSVKSAGTAGAYRVTLGYTPADANFSILVTAHNFGSGAVTRCAAGSEGTASPHFVVQCTDQLEANANAEFSILVMDNT